MCGRKTGKMETSYLFEIKRQLVHLLVGFAIALGVYHLEPVAGKYVVVPLLAAVSFMLVLPRIGAELKLHNHLLFHFERPKDIESFPYRGAIFYALGVSPAILLLDVNTACAIIAILSIGDSTSTIVGKSVGQIRIGHKSLEGSLAFIFFSFIGAWFFLPQQPVYALLLSFLGAVIELSNIYHDHLLMDDNLLVPIALTLAALLS
ncbi:MAG: hypothetical protein B6U97_03870 [Candidatus Altiarchaeales archaeon ex4484_96]|nr:MAG: hypothetical protein B6U97_03870 [Candidatus Altiarchaeales archaeon ex4484_96]